MPGSHRRTLSHEGTFHVEVKGSRFLAVARPVSDPAGARSLQEEMRARHPQARHHVWAARLAEPELWQSYDEDGEPAGTAGRPIMGLLERASLVQVAVVVTRYFGGTLLGAGGLVRAYTQSAQGALEAAGPVEVVPLVRLEASCDYPTAARLEPRLREWGARVVNARYGAEVTWELELPAELEAEVDASLRGQSRGAAVVRRLGRAWGPPPRP
ncbi:IMPACT family protein [Limnochorda pilosa]|uniref:Thymidylate synthase n=1 Tax=Limnochorda pilosa TaxID=1555112 RepID=A0A0K2SIW4_LIMPI|nr:YigZ family protein [Limnochorda pilosa]BAS27030.1 hypothetical protein LIP_1173 [Limnochorda pilosa]